MSTNGAIQDLLWKKRPDSGLNFIDKLGSLRLEEKVIASALTEVEIIQKNFKLRNSQPHLILTIGSEEDYHENEGSGSEGIW